MHAFNPLTDFCFEYCKVPLGDVIQHHHKRFYTSASKQQFRLLLQQGVEDILKSQTNLIRISRKASKEETMKVKVILKNDYLLVSYMCVCTSIHASLSGQSECYTDPLTVKTAFIYLKQQNHSLLQGIIQLLGLSSHALSIPLYMLHTSSSFSSSSCQKTVCFSFSVSF